MSDTGFTCGTHTAQARTGAGTVVLGDLEPLTMVRWHRIRDEISTAEVVVPTTRCCELLGALRTGMDELHIFRNGLPVWEGPITRLEYEYDTVRIFAEDILWVAKRTVLREGYSQAYPYVGNVLTRMDWLLRHQCYVPYGDPWLVVPHLHPLTHPGDPQTTRSVFAYQHYVWEDLDKYAEDYGADYTVVNRDIWYFDIHLAWNVLPDLDEQFISQFPRIVEYGNELATRAYVTNGKGYAGIAEAPAAYTDPTQYGYVDLLITNANDENVSAPSDAPPSAGELAQWSATAANNLDDRYPSPRGIVIPANTTLMPGAPWLIEDLIPGSWFQVSITRMCRTLTEWQRLHEVVVEESAPDGETVAFTAISAPNTMVGP